MNNQLISIITAFAGSSMNNVAQAAQKAALDMPAKPRFKKWGLWVFATLIMMASPFVMQYATSLGGASLVGAMSGSGLASLALFSFFVLKEKISANEASGVALILAASACIGIFSGKEIRSVINLPSLALFMAVVSAAYAALCAISLRLNTLPGIALGGFAGTIGGFVTLLQKVTTSNPTAARSMLFNPFLYAWIFISLFAFILLQLSYKKDKAIRIIPSFTANFIIVPVLGGVMCFNETLNAFQWAGVTLIMCGAMIINTGRK